MEDKKTSKINIGLSVSRNYDKITLEMVEEPIEYSDLDEFKAEIRKRFALLRKEINEEFKNIQ